MRTMPDVVPILSAGRHRSVRTGACFMEFASYLAGERWSDHPACTHPVLAALARDVNDLTSDRARNDLASMIHRVVGLTSRDPYVDALIAMRAASAAFPVASLDRQRALAAGMLNLLAQTDSPALRALAARSFAEAPDCERWARRYLTHMGLTHAFTSHAAQAMVSTAVVGIALACVPDADARLATLLRDTIGDVESVVHGSLVATRDLVLA